MPGVGDKLATGIRIEGLENLRDVLTEQLPNAAHSLLRTGIFGIAQEVRDEIKANTPKRTGQLRKSLKAKRLRGDRKSVASDVIFEHGIDVKNDGWYWRLIEHGTINFGAQPFVNPVVERLRAAFPRILRERVGKALENKLAREAKKRVSSRL